MSQIPRPIPPPGSRVPSPSPLLLPSQLWALLSPPQRQPLLATLVRLWRTLPLPPLEEPHDTP